MSMSSKKLENLISNLTDNQRDAINRFEHYVCSTDIHNDLFLTINRLYDILSPASQGSLAKLLGDLVDAGLLKLVVRIESPETGGGIEDYSSITEVPDTLHDIYSDHEFHVNPENIKILYKLDSSIKNKIFCNN